MSLKYSFIDKVTARQMIKRWLTRWMIDDWVKTKVLSWSLNACIINLNFSNVFSVFEFLTSFTNRELKIRIFVDTFFLLIDKNTFFSSKLAIFFCRDAMNDDTRSIATIVLKMKLAIDAKYFLSRSRSRLIDAMNTIESIMMRLLWDSTIDSVDDSIDDSIDDSVDKNDNLSLLSSFW